MLGPRGEVLGIWLVVDGLSTGENEIILSLLILEQVWPVGVLVEWRLTEILARYPLGSGHGSRYGSYIFWVLGMFKGLEGSWKRQGFG